MLWIIFYRYTMLLEQKGSKQSWKRRKKDVADSLTPRQCFGHISWLVTPIDVIQNVLKTRDNFGRLSCFEKSRIPNDHDVVILPRRGEQNLRNPWRWLGEYGINMLTTTWWRSTTSWWPDFGNYKYFGN